jgi:hypothetical protein
MRLGIECDAGTELHAFRAAYRRRMLSGEYDISRSITTEIPSPELPVAAGKQFPLAVEPPGNPAPACPEVEGPAPATDAPPLPEPERSLSTGRPGILDEPFPWMEVEAVSRREAREETPAPRDASRRRRIRRPGSTGVPGIGIMAVIAACGTAFGFFLLYLLVRFFPG